MRLEGKAMWGGGGDNEKKTKVEKGPRLATVV